MRKIIITFIFLTTSFLLLASISFAINMNSGNYIIQFGNVNIGAKDQTSSNYTLNVTAGQSVAQQFTSTGYYVKAGFQYIHTIVPFKFTISNTVLNLGSLTVNSFSTAPTNLTVSYGSGGKLYQVTAIEETAFQTFNGVYSIPDTSCNGGAATCNVSSAALWTDATKNGFGYNMTGNDIPADFTSSNYFRPFPDRATGGSPSVIMTSTNVGTNRQSTLTFQVSVSGTQTAGQYSTIINFVATPAY